VLGPVTREDTGRRTEWARCGVSPSIVGWGVVVACQSAWVRSGPCCQKDRRGGIRQYGKSGIRLVVWVELHGQETACQKLQECYVS
jgi:hypothetical protein